MKKKYIVIPELEEANIGVAPYVNGYKLCSIYSIRYNALKKIARECKAFRMIRREVFIDVEKFDRYIRQQFGEEDSMRRNDMNNPELCNEVNSGAKKYVRYSEGAELYSMGQHTFSDLAKEADAARKINGVVLVNVLVLNEYIEDMYG